MLCVRGQGIWGSALLEEKIRSGRAQREEVANDRAGSAALWQQNGVDHMDNAIGGFNVRRNHISRIR
ncbi:hypothetical protein GCM10011499_28330 [Pelagibacterium lentulum]|uniref:Uncharacterized protein n=1 Tax=Pelagibacterium lentulum TaxID=2029865 RepID=A0A916RJY6_9HYPH|nr:hypothetical protein GCM10011499_28330 [Pelagibacterium lentulum]